MSNNYPSNTKRRLNDDIYLNFLLGEIRYEPDSELSDSEFSDSYDRRLDDEFNMILKQKWKRGKINDGPEAIQTGVESDPPTVEDNTQRRFSYPLVIDLTSGKKNVNSSTYAAIHRYESSGAADGPYGNEREFVQKEPSETVPPQENVETPKMSLLTKVENGIQRSKRRRLTYGFEDEVFDSISMNQIENGDGNNNDSSEAHVDLDLPHNIEDSVENPINSPCVLPSPNDSTNVDSPLSLLHSTARQSTLPSDFDWDDDSNWTDCESDVTHRTFTKD